MLQNRYKSIDFHPNNQNKTYKILLLSGKHVQGSIITDFLALQALLDKGINGCLVKTL